MRKKGFEMKIVNMILMVLILVVMFVLIKILLIDPQVRNADCQKNGGVCTAVCGPGSYPQAYKCPEKGDICCYDQEKIRGISDDSSSTTGSPSINTKEEAQQRVDELQEQINTVYYKIKDELKKFDTDCKDEDPWTVSKDCQYDGYKTDQQKLNSLENEQTALEKQWDIT